MSKFPAIPLNKQTEKNVKLFLDGLAGRMGIEGRAVTFEDLFSAGVLQIKDGLTINSITDGTDITDIIEVPTDSLDSTPTTPTDLAATSSWGAIFLDWEYKAYSNEGGTEIWRSPVNDRSTASLIALANGRTYTDIVGAQAISYSYWIRNRSGSETNIVSGFNSSNGVQGSSNLKTTVEDFLLLHTELGEEILSNPFAIKSFGTDVNGNTIWKALLNADVLITGDLAIGQLISGEMPTGVEFSIGRGSIVMSTDSETALGSILVTGDGGIAGKDYLRITDSSIVTKVWSPLISDHVDYKELRRVERGQAQNGVQVRIKPYFKKEPTVYLSPEEVTVCHGASALAGLDQRLIIKSGEVTPSLPFDGSWYFTPTAILTLSSGIQTLAEPYVYSGPLDAGSYVSLHPAFSPCVGVSISCTVGSRKKLANTNFKNRKITITVYGSIGGGPYTSLGSNSIIVEGSGATVPIEVVIPTITSGSWQFRYDFLAEDADGETSSGGAEFEYAEDTSTESYWALLSLLTSPSQPLAEGAIQNARPTRDAEWELFEIDYAFTYSWEVKGWCVIVESGTFEQKEAGHAQVFIPGVSTQMEVYGACGAGQSDEANCGSYPTTNYTSRIESGTGTGGTGGKVPVNSSNINLYLDGFYSQDTVRAIGDNNQSNCSPNLYKGTARAQFDVTGYDVTYYYRKRITQDLTVTNYFQVHTVSADLGASDISAGITTINWLATGE